jgi:hypothetical protein
MLFAIIDSSRGTNAIDILLLCQCPLLLLLQHQYRKCKIQFLLFLIQTITEIGFCNHHHITFIAFASLKDLSTNQEKGRKRIEWPGIV